MFLIAFLPPIIFDSALTTDIKYFLKNIGNIAVFAFFGTILACIITGLMIYMVSHLPFCPVK